MDIYPARERAEDYPGVTGLLVAAAAADAAAGRPVYWLPAMDDAERLLSEELREGDVLLTLGAGDIGIARGAPRRAGRDGGGRAMNAPRGVERDYPLARLTTVRTGGDGDFFARADSVERLAELLSLGRRRTAGGRSGRLGLEPPRSR